MTCSIEDNWENRGEKQQEIKHGMHEKEVLHVSDRQKICN